MAEKCRLMKPGIGFIFNLFSIRDIAIILEVKEMVPLNNGVLAIN